jgi:hypothetical protein
LTALGIENPNLGMWSVAEYRLNGSDQPSA